MTETQALNLKTGDRVRWIADRALGTIVAISPDSVRVRWDDGKNESENYRTSEMDCIRVIK